MAENKKGDITFNIKKGVSTIYAVNMREVSYWLNNGWVAVSIQKATGSSLVVEVA